MRIDRQKRKELHEQSSRLVEAMRPLLTDQEPIAVGLALAEMVAIHLAGHHPELRGDAKRALFELVDDLLPIVLGIMNNNGVIPREWRKH